AFQFWVLFGTGSRIRLRLSDLRIVPDVIGSLIRVSTTGVLQFAIAHVRWIGLMRMVSGFGSIAVAGYTIGIRIFIFAILPAWGLSGAAAAMGGPNLGSKETDVPLEEGV